MISISKSARSMLATIGENFVFCKQFLGIPISRNCFLNSALLPQHGIGIGIYSTDNSKQDVIFAYEVVFIVFTVAVKNY